MGTALDPIPTHKSVEKIEDETVKLLRSIDTKLDSLNEKIDRTEARAITKGAIAGGVSGGIVATVIAVIQSKFGM